MGSIPKVNHQTQEVFEMKVEQLPDGSYADVVSVPDSLYLGEEEIKGNGASQAATLPAGTKLVWISAEDGVAYATVNGAASTGSGTYCPQDGTRPVGPYSNMTSLAVYAANGVTVHLTYVG